MEIRINLCRVIQILTNFELEFTLDWNFKLENGLYYFFELWLFFILLFEIDLDLLWN